MNVIARWAEIETELKVDERELTDPQKVRLACAYNDGIRDAVAALQADARGAVGAGDALADAVSDIMADNPESVLHTWVRRWHEAAHSGGGSTMSVLERCPECGGPVGPFDLEAENENLRGALATVARTEQATAEQLRGAVNRGLALRRAISVALANLSPGIAAHMVLAEAAALYDYLGGVARADSEAREMRSATVALERKFGGRPSG